jgi:hypothetical protein
MSFGFLPQALLEMEFYILLSFHLSACRLGFTIIVRATSADVCYAREFCERNQQSFLSSQWLGWLAFRVYWVIKSESALIHNACELDEEGVSIYFMSCCAVCEPSYKHKHLKYEAALTNRKSPFDEVCAFARVRSVYTGSSFWNFVI